MPAVPASAAPTRPPMPDLATEVQRLERVVAELKRRESLYVRAISAMLIAPTLVSADVVDGHWEALFDNGERWRCVPVLRRSQHQPSHEWVLTKASVPVGRGGIKADLDQRLAERVPLHLAPRDVA